MAVLGLLQIADVVTTGAALRAVPGAQESNPIAGFFLERGLLPAVKFAVWAGVAALTLRSRRVALAMWGAIGLYGLVVANNLSVLSSV